MAITTRTFDQVNVGASANSGTGDGLRDAFIRVNSNFSNISGVGFNAANIQVTKVLYVSGSTTATSANTGAFIVDGGAGIAGNLYVGGDLTVLGNTSTVNTEIINVTQTVIGNLTAANLIANTGITAIRITATGNIVAANISATNRLTTTIITANGNVDSTSTSTGTMLVTGGLGVSGNAFITTVYTNGVGVSGDIIATGNLIAGNGNLLLNTSGYLFNSPAYGTQSQAQARGIIQSQQYFLLNSNVSIANAGGDYRIFNNNVYVSGSTIYEFETSFALVRRDGTTAHTISFNLGTGTTGLATFNWIDYQYVSSNAAPLISGAIVTSGAGNSFGFGNVATNVTIQGSTVTAALDVWTLVKGTFSVNGGGWISPRLGLSAAPGGIYYTQTGSYFKLSPIGSSGANVSVGSWAV
jgi:hypothetical protein